MSVLKFFDIEIKSPTLPAKETKIDYIPTEDDIKLILSEVKGTKYEVPFVLGTLGLRRSEICALTKEDLTGNVLSINKALVLNEHNEWTLKNTTKTDKSTRTVVVPEYIAELIRKDGACPVTPHSLYWKLQRVQMKLGIPRFPFHKLRHFFASYLHENGFTDKQIQEMGGWATGNIMKSVYTHAMSMDSAKNEASNLIGSLL
ncbi:MAG: site-specific integrase [Bacteroidales bacterium]|nr:site-specific integrase [Bacteroidales bacterium]